MSATAFLLIKVATVAIGTAIAIYAERHEKSRLRGKLRRLKQESEGDGLGRRA